MHSSQHELWPNINTWEISKNKTKKIANNQLYLFFSFLFLSLIFLKRGYVNHDPQCAISCASHQECTRGGSRPTPRADRLLWSLSSIWSKSRPLARVWGCFSRLACRISLKTAAIIISKSFIYYLSIKSKILWRNGERRGNEIENEERGDEKKMISLKIVAI